MRKCQHKVSNFGSKIVPCGELVATKARDLKLCWQNVNIWRSNIRPLFKNQMRGDADPDSAALKLNKKKKSEYFC